MSKKRKLGHGPARPAKALQHMPRGGGGQPPKRKPTSSSSNGRPSSSSTSTPTTTPFLPFDPEHHHILLVGEGDLSFAAALVDHHACLHVAATVLEPSPAALAAKYPHAAANAARIEAAGGTVAYGVDATKLKLKLKPKITGRKQQQQLYDRILFNFPHVGGKSTDVNRQVRHNQELLVAFFRAARALLAPAGAIVVTLFDGEPYTLWNIRDLARHTDLQVERSFRFSFAAYPGYHHARTLGVVRRGGAGHKQGTEEEEDGDDGEKDPDNNDNNEDDGDDDDNNNDNDNDGRKRKHDSTISTTAWRGEDRAARSYVFIRKEDATPPGIKSHAQPPPQKQNPKQKRRRPGDSSDEDD